MAIFSKTLLKVSGIKHGFGSRAENVPSPLEPEWSAAHPSWLQVHGDSFCEIQTPLQKCGEVDALTTAATGIPVAVVTADCVPLLFARRDGSRVAAVHAGWRGTLSGVTSHLWKYLGSQGEKASEWAVAIGPSIRPCCYEVSEDLVREFSAKKTDLQPKLISPQFRRLDLQAIHQAELKRMGFAEIDVIPLCTRCTGGEDPEFHSYRRDQNKDRQYSGIVIVSSNPTR